MRGDCPARLTDAEDKEKLRHEHHHFTRRMRRREEARAADIANGLVPAGPTAEEARATLNPITAKEAKTARPVGPRRGTV